MAYTTDQLSAIESAIAAGITRVEIAGRMVQYASISDMLKLRAQMQSELGAAPAPSARGRAWWPATGNGL